MSDIKNETTAVGNDSDDVLNELLKSALDDFSDAAASPTEAHTSVLKDEDSKEAGVKLREDFEAKFENLLLNNEDDATFSQKMKDFISETKNELKSHSNNSYTDMPDDNTDIENSDVVTQAINNLVEHMAEISDTIDKDPLQNDFNFNDPKNRGMFPMMEQMFQMFISKEVLYPSLVAVKNQYPTWIDENKNKVSSHEINRYTKQYNIIKEICVIFEGEDDSDSEDIKQKRMIQLLGLFEQMTELGQPPKDFANSLSSIPFGNESNLANDVPDNCNAM